MKVSPDNTVDTENVDNATVDANVIGDRSTAVLECDTVIVLSSGSEAEEEEEEVRVRGDEQKKQEEQEQEQVQVEEEEEDEVSRPRKSKKKHKKHHHGDYRIEKKHKKRAKGRSGAIFLWAKKRETKILNVICEDYDPGIKLTKTNGVWTSCPRSKVLAAAQSRSSVCVDVGESQNACDESAEQKKQPDERIKEIPKSIEPTLVDLNDNSIDFVDTISSDEDDDEAQTRAKIDQALEMIERDPELMNDVKISLPTIEATAAIKLPEGTTIHQIKLEKAAINGAVSRTTPPLLSPKTPPVQRKLGEVTITSQQQQQNEPLNLETVSKRSALEIRLQEPPLKRKRVDKLPAQPPLQDDEQVKREWDPLSELKEVLSDPGLCVPDPLLVPRARLAALVASPATEIPKLLRAPSMLPPPLPDPDLLAVSLSHLRSILQQQPGYVDDRKQDSNQPSNIDQMLWLSYMSKDTGVDTDLISTMLSILLPSSTTAQQSYSYPQDKNQWSDMYYDGNIEQPYGSTPGYSKSDDYCASVSPLPPPSQAPPQILPPPQQSHPLLLPPPQSQMLPPPTATQPPILSPKQPQKHQQQSQLLPPPPPQVQQQVPRLLPKRSQQHSTTPKLRLPSHPQQMPQILPSQPQQMPQLLPSRSQQLVPSQLQPPVLHRQSKRRACQELCCNGSPSSCYGCSCCPKSSSYNPFAAASPNGCNPFTVSPGDCNTFSATPAANCGGGNPKACIPYTASGVMPTYCFPSEIGCGYNGQSSSSMPPRNTSVSPRNRAQYNYQTGSGQQQQQQQQMSMAEGGSSVSGFCIGVTSYSSSVVGCGSGVVGCSSGVVGCSIGVTSCSSGSGVAGSSSGVAGSSSGVAGSSSGVAGSSSGVAGSSSGVAGSSSGVAGSSSGVNSSVSGGTVSDIGMDYQCSTATNKPKTPLPATPTSGDAGQPAYRPTIKVKKHLIDPNAKPRLLNIEGALHLAAGHDLFSSSLWHPLFGSQAKTYGCRWQWTTPVTTSASTSSDDTPADTKR